MTEKRKTLTDSRKLNTKCTCRGCQCQMQNAGKSPWSLTSGAVKAGVVSGDEKDGLNNSEKVDFCVLFPSSCRGT